MTTPSPRQRGLLLAAVAVVFGYLLISAREPLRLNWGDPWSDANVLTALNYSSEYGFLKTSFTDVLDVGPLSAEKYRYTHYPPLAEIFYGCVRKIAGGSPLDITVYRIFAIGFAAIGLRGLYKYVTGVWGKELATWAVALCATNLLWVQFADSMHQSPVLFATGMTALASVPAWVRDGKRASAITIGIGTYLCFLVAYDYYFFVPTVALLTARVLGIPLLSKRMFKLAALIATCGLLSIATKAAFVVGALGWHGFVEDLGFQFLERATTKYSPDYRVGIITVLCLRWTSYFTPALFIAAIALFYALLRDSRRAGIFKSLRALFLGTEELHDHPASILLLLVAAVPFLFVFSELSAEQALPSQVLIPFYAVGGAWLVTRAGKNKPALASAALAAFVVWQLAHLARVPKTFLDREGTERIRDYLRKNDTNDFLVTNLMADGPVQYFFERHLHPPSDRPVSSHAQYAELTNMTRSGLIHVVYFEDPGTRFIDKSLWPLLASKSRWAIFGYPYLFRTEALASVSEWDARILQGLQENGKEVLHIAGMRVFQIGADPPSYRKDLIAQLKVSEPTRYIDFGKREADRYKLNGFRFAENYPDVPGFCWTVAQGYKATVLTKRGLTYRPDSPVRNESTLLLHFDQQHDARVTLMTWGSINDEILSASIDGTEVLAPTNLGPGQTRSEISFVVPKALQQGEPVKEVLFKFNAVAEWGGGVSFAIMHIDPVLEPAP